jgi:hypothetical protein
MRKRIGPGLAAVAAGLVVLASGLGQSAAQDKSKKAKTTPPKFLYGHDLRVRPGGEKDWPKARKLGVEVFQDEATKADIAISEDGAVAVFPAGGLGEQKEFKYLTGLDMLVRKAGEAEFTQGTQRFGVELFRDLRSNRLLYACQTGSIASAPVPGSLVEDRGPKWHHGLTLKVREPDQDKFDTAKAFGVEVYKDENTGGLLYVTETGSVAAGPQAPAAQPDKNKVARPKPAYGLILRVRKADESDFTDKTRRVGVEVFEDPNANALVYLSETGSVAVVANPGKLQDGGPPTWKAAMALAARRAGDKDFEKARKYGIEAFQDNRTGNLVFISETGSIAVLPK